MHSIYMVTSVACSSTPCNVYAWLYRGCGYCLVLSIPCISSNIFGFNVVFNVTINYMFTNLRNIDIPIVLIVKFQTKGRLFEKQILKCRMVFYSHDLYLEFVPEVLIISWCSVATVTLNK